MIALDTNMLVYAHRKDSPWHREASVILQRLAEGAAPWAIPWHCVHEFIGIVTHPGIYKPPTPLEVAIHDLESWFASPSLRLIGEPPAYWRGISNVIRAGAVAGPLVHDARVAAVCLAHGVSALLSADRDFSRFPALTVRNPLVSLG